MKYVYILFLMALIHQGSSAQRKPVDSLLAVLNKQTTDSGRARQLMELGSLLDFQMLKGDSTLQYLEEAVELSKKTGDAKLETESVYYLANYLIRVANYPRALILSLENLKKLEQLEKEKKIRFKFSRDRDLLFYQTRLLVFIYGNISDAKKQLEYINKLQEIYSRSLSKDAGAINYQYTIYFNLAQAYTGLSMPDSSFYYRSVLYRSALQRGDAQWLALSSSALGDHYLKQNNIDSAMKLFRIGIPAAVKSNRSDIVVLNELHIGELFQKRGLMDSAFFYTRHALQTLSILNNPKDLMKAYRQLSVLYQENNQFDSAHKYLESFVQLKDSLLDETKMAEAQNFVFNQTLREQQVEQAKKEARQKAATQIKLYALLAIIIFALLTAGLLLRNLRNKRNANILLMKQKAEVQTSLAALKEAQSQLIQSEKMASLGELTAGIAHEIQNPLNFVNNFSEVSRELLDEMKVELQKGNSADALDLAEDVMQNLEKINHHGKRADAIVKGMLQHSRKSDGKKEATNINALCDEYLRLSYHGLRAKNKSFNATFLTDFDPRIENILIIPQDIGRVLMNLLTNAFYAVHEKEKSLAGQPVNSESYKPTVLISTSQTSAGVLIKVSDNGAGIPVEIIDKIFQPFFTSKPTGQGTGLGLSMSYDIIKAHQGTLRVEQANMGGDVNEMKTIFIVELPTI